MSPLGRRPDRLRLTGGESGASKPTWEQIAHSHGRFIYTVAYRLTNRREEAEDLVQEVMVRVQRGLAGYQPGSLEGWLARITTNAFVDQMRRRSRRPTEPLGDDAERRLPASPAADEAAALDRLPDDLKAALAELPPEFRAAIVLCDVVGLSYDEIAASLDVPIGTVRSRIHRGRLQLRSKVTR